MPRLGRGNARITVPPTSPNCSQAHIRSGFHNNPTRKVPCPMSPPFCKRPGIPLSAVTANKVVMRSKPCRQPPAFLRPFPGSAGWRPRVLVRAEAQARFYLPPTAPGRAAHCRWPVLIHLAARTCRRGTRTAPSYHRDIFQPSPRATLFLVLTTAQPLTIDAAGDAQPEAAESEPNPSATLPQSASSRTGRPAHPALTLDSHNCMALLVP